MLGLFSINLAAVVRRRLTVQPRCALFCGSALFVGTDRGHILPLSAYDLRDAAPPLLLRGAGSGSAVAALAVNDRQTKLYSAHHAVSPHGAEYSVISTWAASPGR